MGEGWDKHQPFPARSVPANPLLFYRCGPIIAADAWSSTGSSSTSSGSELCRHRAFVLIVQQSVSGYIPSFDALLLGSRSIRRSEDKMRTTEKSKRRYTVDAMTYSDVLAGKNDGTYLLLGTQ